MISRKRGFREGDYICRVFYQGNSKWKIISRLRSRCSTFLEEPWIIESVKIRNNIIKGFEPMDMIYQHNWENNLYRATSNQILILVLQKRSYYLGLRT